MEHSVPMVNLIRVLFYYQLMFAASAVRQKNPPLQRDKSFS